MIFFALVAVLALALVWVAVNAHFCNMAFDAEEARNTEDKAIKAGIKRDSHHFAPAGFVAADHCIGKTFTYPPVSGRR